MNQRGIFPKKTDSLAPEKGGRTSFPNPLNDDDLNLPVERERGVDHFLVINRKVDRKFRFVRSFFLGITIGAFLFLNVRPLPAQRGSDIPPVWNQPVHFQIQDVPLTDALSMVTQSDGLSFFIDRRIDPEIPVTGSADGESLLSALSRLVASSDLDLVPIGRLCYIAPRGMGGDLLLLRALHRQKDGASSNESRDALDQAVTIEEDRFTEPATLLKNSAKKVGLGWSGLDKMPFDQWRPVHLPTMPSRELFTLILFGFNVDYRLDEKKPVLRPIAIDRKAEVTRLWPAEETVAFPREEFPDIHWADLRNELQATGPFESIARLESLAMAERIKNADSSSLPSQGKNSPSSSLSGSTGKKGKNAVISGEVRQATLGSLFDDLRKSFDLEFFLDPSLDAVGISPQTRVSCRFKDSNQKQALKIIADELGVSVRIEGERAIFYKK